MDDVEYVVIHSGEEIWVDILKKFISIQTLFAAYNKYLEACAYWVPTLGGYQLISELLRFDFFLLSCFISTVMPQP